MKNRDRYIFIKPIIKGKIYNITDIFNIFLAVVIKTMRDKIKIRITTIGKKRKILLAIIILNV